MIFERMKSVNKKMMKMEEVTGSLDRNKLDVLVTIGAGDIDRLVEPIEKKLKGSGGG
jgi:UDP-N-acetylmuramate--alanine ligase